MIAIKHIPDFPFKDKSFPLTIRTSAAHTDGVGAASRALHEAIEIKCFFEGSSTLLIGNKSVRAEAGDIIVINPYEVHGTIDAAVGANGKYHLIMVGLDFFSGATSCPIDLRHIVFGKKTVFKTHFPKHEKLFELLTRAAKEQQRDGEYSKIALFGIMAEVFAILLEEGVENGGAISGEDALKYYGIIEPALRMIRDGYSSDFTVDRLADACLVSKYHFCRIFKAVMGMGAIQYLNSYRLKIADAMLSNTDLRISEIAASCGFEDTGYFSRIYKKQFGRTPKNERKNTK